MIEAKKAAFSFEDFKVPSFSYNEKKHSGLDLKIAFSPSGEYDSSTGKYKLMLLFIVNDGQNTDRTIFELISIATFRFESPISVDEIPDYFYQNAIAIMFPYVRSFVSTLTLQANTKLLNLGLMNLSELERPLRENTKLL